MIVELSPAVVVFVPIAFIGVAKSRKSAVELWRYLPPIPYPIIPSRHEIPGKPIGERECTE